MTIEAVERDSREAARSRMLANDEPLLRRAWHPVAMASEVVDAPLGVELLGEKWVLVRSAADGEVRAFRDRCPHRRALLSGGRVVDGQLECPYHGYRFAVDGAEPGRCVAIPVLGDEGRLPVTGIQPAWGVVERYGLVWLAPEEPLAALPEVECFGGPGLTIGIISQTTHVSAGLLIDNFLDVAHFSYLHSQSFGISSPVTAADYVTSRDGWTSILTHSTAVNPATIGEDSAQARYATYAYTAPYTVELRTNFAGGFMEAAALAIAPRSANASTAYVLVAWPADEPSGLEAQLALSAQVLAEDLSILETIEDPRLPLDVRMEFHTRGDKASVNMRRILVDYLDAAESRD